MSSTVNGDGIASERTDVGVYSVSKFDDGSDGIYIIQKKTSNGRRTSDD
jgi:uncharacterized membrane protein